LQVARSAFRSPLRHDNELTPHSGSTFQLRYFLPGSLSFEPLGTSPIMLLDIFRVKGKTALSSAIYLLGINYLD
jgi:hypothetical protein